MSSEIDPGSTSLAADEPSQKRIKLDNKEMDPNENEDLFQLLSKRQMKKLKKKERWQEVRAYKRAKEKERKKQRKLEAQLTNVRVGPSRKELKHCTMARSNCKVTVAIDLSFDDYMTEKDLSKCIKQVLRCYSINRRAKNPLQLHITSFNGKSKQEMSKNTGYENWDVNFHDKNFSDVFDKPSVVYLCSESENVISTLNDNLVYVIGGLVDHNAHKGLTFQRAQESCLQHCQLPIGEYLKMSTRKVLTIDHVFEILLAVSEGKQWKDAFLEVLPRRKGAIEKKKERKYSLSNSSLDGVVLLDDTEST